MLKKTTGLFPKKKKGQPESKDVRSELSTLSAKYFLTNNNSSITTQNTNNNNNNTNTNNNSEEMTEEFSIYNEESHGSDLESDEEDFRALEEELNTTTTKDPDDPGSAVAWPFTSCLLLISCSWRFSFR
jgi:hypothetical protein